MVTTLLNLLCHLLVYLKYDKKNKCIYFNLGLVIELCGLVKFTTGPRNIEHIFGVDKNSSTVLKSQVYCQILGCAEGNLLFNQGHAFNYLYNVIYISIWLIIFYPALEKGTLPSKLKSVVLPGSHIIEFQLILPKNRPLPPSMSGKYVEVTYNIILYKRTQENGYKPMGDRFKKLINFHGFNPLQTVQPLSSMLWENPVVQPFSGCGISGALQIPKTNYLKQEEIAFHVQIEKDGTNVSQVLAKCVKVSLLKTVIANYSTEVEELDSFITNKDYFNEGNNNVCVKGVFTSKRDHPSYKDLTIGGLLIIHNIKVRKIKIYYDVQCPIFLSDFCPG